jgi:hypothetical protein
MQQRSVTFEICACIADTPVQVRHGMGSGVLACWPRNNRCSCGTAWLVNHAGA